MAQVKIGKVAFVDKGTFNIATIYSLWDFVVTADSTYLYIAQTGSAGHEVTNTAFWKCLADGKPTALAAAAAAAITTQATAAEALRVTAENTRVSQESGRISAENTRVTHEDTRQSNETGRVGNESTRVTNETARGQNEINRTSAEATRVSNENLRQGYENTRQENEYFRFQNEDARFENEDTRQSNETGRVGNEIARVTTFNSQMSAASTATTNAQNAADSANAAVNEVDSAVLSAGFLGTIATGDAAPTPARNGFYKFSDSGAKPAWLTALSGVTNVMAGDEVGVTFTAPSTYTYTHIATASMAHSDSSYVDDVCQELEAQGITIPAYYLKSLGAKKLISKSSLNPAIVGSRLGVGMTQDINGNWVYADHNLWPNSVLPITCTITTIVGAFYTFSHVGSGSIVASGAGTGTSTNGGIVTITATTTSLVLTCSGIITRPICCYGSTLLNYVETTGSAKFPLRYNEYERGYMFWGQTVNLVPNTNVAAASWIRYGQNTTVTDNYPIASPVDGCTVQKISFTAAEQSVSPRLTEITAGAYYAYRVFVRKPDTGGALACRLASTNGFTWGTGISTKLTLTNEWQEIILSGALISSGFMLDAQISTQDASNVFDPDCVGDVLVCCPTLNPGLVVHPPIPTYGASVVCSADPTTIPLAATGLTDAAGCVVARFRPGLSPGSDDSRSVFSCYPSSGAPLYCMHDGHASIYYGSVVIAGSADYADGKSHTSVVSWNTGGLATVRTEYGSESTSAFTSGMVNTPITIGSWPDGSSSLNGYISELWTIPTQPNLTNRTKLAKLWT